MAATILKRVEAAQKSLADARVLLPAAFETSRPPPSSPVAHYLQPYTHPFQSRLNALTREINRQRSFFIKELDSEVGSLFKAVTKDLDSDTEALHRYLQFKIQISTHGIDEELPRDLKLSVAYYDEVVGLLESFLRLKTLGQDLNSHPELKNIRNELEDARTSLESDLRSLFQCNTLDILPKQQAEAPEVRSLTDSGPFARTVKISTILLHALHERSRRVSPGFPHDANITVLLDAALYWLARHHEHLTEYPNGFDEQTGGHIHCGIIRTCWLLHCLYNHSQLRNQFTDVNLVVCVLLQHAASLLKQFSKLERTKFHLPTPERYCEFLEDFCIAPPRRASLDDRLSFENSGSSSAPPTSSQDSGPPSSLLPEPQPSEAEVELTNPEADSGSLRFKSGFDEDIEATNSTTPNWGVSGGFSPCRVHIFKTLSKTGHFRVWTGLLSSPLVIYDKPLDPHSTELIPQYAYDYTSRLIWFRQREGTCDISYRFKEDSTQIFAFQEVFTTDTWHDTFTGITRFHLSDRGNCRVKCTNVIAQIWDEPPVQIPQQINETSSPTSSEWRRMPVRVEAFEEQYSPSKILVYANFCIYTIFLTEKIQCESKPNNRVELKSVGRSTAIRVHIREGTKDRPAGIPLGGSAAYYSDDQGSRSFSSIELTFALNEHLKKFVQDVSEAHQHWAGNRRRWSNSRKVQQNPVVQTRSGFRTLDEPP